MLWTSRLFPPRQALLPSAMRAPSRVCDAEMLILRSLDYRPSTNQASPMCSWISSSLSRMLTSNYQVRQPASPPHPRVAPPVQSTDHTHASLSCYLSQKPSQQGLAIPGFVPGRVCDTRRCEGTLPRSVTAHPRALANPSAPPTRAHPPAHSALRLPRPMADLPGLYHPAPQHKRGPIRPSWPAVPLGYLPGLQIQG